MKIQIEKITNGWILSIANPKGQSAIFCEDFDDVIEQLKSINKEMKTPPSNVTGLPRQ